MQCGQKNLADKKRRGKISQKFGMKKTGKLVNILQRTVGPSFLVERSGFWVGGWLYILSAFEDKFHHKNLRDKVSLGQNEQVELLPRLNGKWTKPQDTET